MANRSSTPVEPFFPFVTETLREASAVLLVPRLETYFKGKREYIPSRTPVFYNPLMSFNRDVAVLALRAYQRRVQRSLDVCEPFTGCGVRGIRFAKEAPQVSHLVLNDLNPQAINLTRFNVERNGLSEKITIQQLDAHALLSRHARPKKRFDGVPDSTGIPPIAWTKAE